MGNCPKRSERTPLGHVSVAVDEIVGKHSVSEWDSTFLIGRGGRPSRAVEGSDNCDASRPLFAKQPLGPDAGSRRRCLGSSRRLSRPFLDRCLGNRLVGGGGLAMRSPIALRRAPRKAICSTHAQLRLRDTKRGCGVAAVVCKQPDGVASALCARYRGLVELGIVGDDVEPRTRLGDLTVAAPGEQRPLRESRERGPDTAERRGRNCGTEGTCRPDGQDRADATDREDRVRGSDREDGPLGSDRQDRVARAH